MLPLYSFYISKYGQFRFDHISYFSWLNMPKRFVTILCIVERLSSASANIRPISNDCFTYMHVAATNASGSMRHNGNVILNEIVDSKPQLQICFAGIRELRVLFMKLQ